MTKLTLDLFDRSLPIEIVPPVYIRTSFDENGLIVIDPKWWDKYTPTYDEFHVREHILKNVNERCYVQLNIIFIWAKFIHDINAPHIGVPYIDSSFVQNHVLANHTMLKGKESGCGYSKVSVYLLHPYNNGGVVAPLFFPEEEYYYKTKWGLVKPSDHSCVTMYDGNENGQIIHRELL